jgi:sulfopyruvate decarboxylase subunit alpha
MSEPVRKFGTMPALAAQEIIGGMVEGGINFISLLAESEFLTVQKAVLKDERFMCVPVCNEATGICVCGGAWAGGKKPAMLIGATGFGIASYALTWIGMGYHMPFLLLITTRTIGDRQQIYGVSTHIVEPFLKTLGFPVASVNRISDARRTIRDACTTAFGWMKPVAVILSGELIGARSD